MVRDLFREFDDNPCFSDLVTYAPSDFEEVLAATNSSEIKSKAEEALTILRSLKQCRELLIGGAGDQNEILTDMIHGAFRLGQLWHQVRVDRRRRVDGGRNSSKLTAEQWQSAIEWYCEFKRNDASDSGARIRTAGRILKEFKITVTPDAVRSHVNA